MSEEIPRISSYCQVKLGKKVPNYSVSFSVCVGVCVCV